MRKNLEEGLDTNYFHLLDDLKKNSKYEGSYHFFPKYLELVTKKASLILPFGEERRYLTQAINILEGKELFKDRGLKEHEKNKINSVKNITNLKRTGIVLPIIYAAYELLK